MKPIDRLILTVLAAGVWVVVGLAVFRILANEADDIEGLQTYVQNVIEDCKVEGQSIDC